MIQDGDLFSVKDLKESVQQVTDMDLLRRERGRAFDVLNMTPNQYADKMIGLYADVKSSAVDLDKNLRDLGLRTTYKFSHKYNIPGLTYDEIVRDAYKLGFLYKLASSPLRIHVPIRKSGVFDDAARVSYYYAQYIWAANPSARFDYAARIMPYHDWGRVLCFLLGVGFKFHPRDIYEFVMVYNNPELDDAGLRKKRQEQEVFKKWCAKHNVDTGCLVLCPGHQEKLRKIINRTDTPYAIQWLQQLFKVRKY